MCKKQTQVSHSSTESEIIPLDAGLRMDWSPARTKPPTKPAAGNCSNKSNPNKRETEMVINCGPRYHKRTLPSRWVSVVHFWRQRSSDQNDHQRAEVQRWGTCQEPTELRLMGWKEDSRKMNGTFFFFCLTSWISQCFPAAIFFQTESSVSCPREFRKVPWKWGRQWRSRDQWYVGIKEPLECEERILRKSWVNQTAQENQELDHSGVLSSQKETVARHQPKSEQCILKRGNKVMLNLLALGNRSGEMNLETRPAPGNWVARGEDNQLRKVEVSLPQHADLQLSVLWESLQEFAEKVESRRRRTTKWERSVEDPTVGWFDLGNCLMSTNTRQQAAIRTSGILKYISWFGARVAWFGARVAWWGTLEAVPASDRSLFQRTSWGCGVAITQERKLFRVFFPFLSCARLFSCQSAW